MALFNGNVNNTPKAEAPATEAKATTPVVETPKPTAPKAEATERVYSEKNAAKLARERKQREAIDQILTYLDGKADTPNNIKELCKVASPKHYGLTGGFGTMVKADVSTAQNDLLKIFGKKSLDEITVGLVADELTVFNAVKKARSDMTVLRRELIKDPRKFEKPIYLDFVDGNYKVVSIGTEPEGWTGYKVVEAK